MVATTYYLVFLYRNGHKAKVRHERNTKYSVLLPVELEESRIAEIKYEHRTEFLKPANLLPFMLVLLFFWFPFHGLIYELHRFSSHLYKYATYQVVITNKACTEVKIGLFMCEYKLQPNDSGYSKLNVPKHIYDEVQTNKIDIKVGSSFFGKSIVAYRKV